MNQTTKDAILDAAATVLSKNPGASLSDVVQQAGVGRATLHRYFSSREKLIRELTLEAFRQSDEATAEIQWESLSGKEALRQMLEAIVPLGDRFRFLLSEPSFQYDPEIAELYERQAREMKDLVDVLKAEGTIAPDVPTAWVVASIDALIYAAWSAVNEGDVARKDAPGLVFRTLLKGLAP